MSVEYREGTATNSDDFFTKIDDLLTDNGWTQHDVLNASTGTQDYVYRSPSALDATAGNYCYIRLTRAGSEAFNLRSYCDWDTTNHAGMFGAGGTSQTTLSGSSFAYWARVNNFALAVAVKISGTYSRGYVGFTRRGYKASKAGITKTSGSHSSGVSSMAVASDMTGKLKVGQSVTIMNNAHNSASGNAEHAELLIINTIASGTLTFTTSTTLAYDTGAVIGANPTPAMAVPITNNAPFNTAFTGLWPVTGEVSGVTSQQVVIEQIPMVGSTAESRNDPSDGYAEFVGGLFSACWTSGTRNGFAGYLYHWEMCTFGTQSNEDIMDDGDNTFVILYNNGSDYCVILGPK